MRKAVFTICRDERFFLPIWLHHYKQHFKDEDIYVLDNNTKDGSTTGLDVNVIPVTHEKAFDHDWMRETVQNFQHKLLKEGYDRVLFAEADEIVFGYKKPLSQVIDESDPGYHRCLGWNLMHHPEHEPALDLTMNIIEQRILVGREDAMCKTLLSSVPLTWGNGFHKVYPEDWEEIKFSVKWPRNKNGAIEGPVPHPELHLLHLRYMDYDVYMQRNREHYRLPHNLPLDHNSCYPDHKPAIDYMWDRYMKDGECWYEPGLIPDWMRESLPNLRSTHNPMTIVEVK